MTTNAPYIRKDRALKAGEDYTLLHREGIEYIEALGSALWTDYNVHDPGITTLEMLCYAITDLAYRTSYPVEDILADRSGGQAAEKKNFFSAREILTCNAVTLNDFRRLLIDVPGVKNGWFQIAGKIAPDLFIHCKKSRLTLEKGAGVEPLSLRGLYDVILEFEKDPSLGDLNRPDMEGEATAGDETFSFTVTLPPWHDYFTERKRLEKVKLLSLSSIEKSQSYKGSFQVTIEGGAKITRHLTVISEGLKTPENEQAIKDSLSGGLLERYLSRINRSLEISSAAFSRLHASRNLCEDFYSFSGVETEEVALCADIEVTTEADIEKALAEIYYRVGHFLDPAIRFYNIRELLEKGKGIDEIFRGPVLDHGFIDDGELKVSEFREVIHVSDIIQIIMDVEGVTAVKTILMTNFFNGQPLTTGEPWCLKIGKNRRARFTMERSKIVFYKGLIPYAARKGEVLANLRELLSMDRHNRLTKGEHDLEIPTGQNRNIGQYHSIQNDYPLVYGIGKDGLAGSSTKLRKAQAKQLKAFLLFFDKILADYLAQLSSIRELFSLNPDTRRTYFTQPLFNIPGVSGNEAPGIRNLMKEFVDTLDLEVRPDIDIDDASTFEAEWNAFVQNIKEGYEERRKRPDPLVETQALYENRKNRFLDHLMARFGEQFTDYVLLLYSMDRKKAATDLIEDKLVFINDYPMISYQRGRAFNYKDPDSPWFTDNVSGLQKRATRLLGISSYLMRFLSLCIDDAFEIYQEIDEDGIDEYRFRLKNADGDILLSSSRRYYAVDDAYAEMGMVSRYGAEKANYRLEDAVDGRFYFNLSAPDGEVIARRIEYFETEAERDAEIDKVIAFMNESADCEGFHLLEHILLRPRTDGDRLLNVCVEENCSGCTGFIDPYSFRATAVVPYWPKRFLNEDFRNFFETTLRMEAPAHVHIKICWVTKEVLAIFEERYDSWLEEMAKARPDQLQLTARQNELVESLASLRSVYRESRLFDCRIQEKENPVLLNLSILGTTKEG